MHIDTDFPIYINTYLRGYSGGALQRVQVSAKITRKKSISVGGGEGAIFDVGADGFVHIILNNIIEILYIIIKTRRRRNNNIAYTYDALAVRA